MWEGVVSCVIRGVPVGWEKPVFESFSGPIGILDDGN